jgi:hypothetical protein
MVRKLYWLGSGLLVDGQGEPSGAGQRVNPVIVPPAVPPLVGFATPPYSVLLDCGPHFCVTSFGQIPSGFTAALTPLASATLISLHDREASRIAGVSAVTVRVEVEEVETLKLASPLYFAVTL